MQTQTNNLRLIGAQVLHKVVSSKIRMDIDSWDDLENVDKKKITTAGWFVLDKIIFMCCTMKLIGCIASLTS